jgi:hypothetical protein
MHAAKSVHAATAEVIQRSKPTHALQRQEAHEHELPNSHVLRPMARLHIGGTRRFATSRYLAVKAGKDYPPGSHGWAERAMATTVLAPAPEKRSTFKPKAESGNAHNALSTAPIGAQNSSAN